MIFRSVLLQGCIYKIELIGKMATQIFSSGMGCSFFIIHQIHKNKLNIIWNIKSSVQVKAHNS